MAQVVQQQRTKVRLDVSTLRIRLARLGLEVSIFQSGSGKIQALAPKGGFCQQMSQAGQHCESFLSELAHKSIADPRVKCGSCLPGAFTLVRRTDATVVLGCFVSKSLGTSEELMRAASQLQLDQRALLDLACGQARYRDEDAEILSEMLAQTVEDIYSRSGEQANDVKSLSRHLGETYEELSFIYKLNNAMNVTANPEEYFGQIAEDLGKLLGVRAVIVALSAQTLTCKEKGTTVIHWGELPVSEEQIMERIRPQMQFKSGGQARSESSHCPTWSSNDAELGNILLAPIVRGERQLGMIIALESTDAREFDNIDATRLSNVANSAAVFLENFRLYGSLRQLFLGSMRALTSSIDAKDPYTCGHSERVALLSKRLAEIMGWSKAQAERIYLCGLLHDIGKIGVPEAVLQKPGKLTDIEFSLIKKHPVIGAKIIRGIQEMEDLVPGVLHHHERMDGRGYPGGLKSEAIPIQARVLCVADALDAMTSDRPYRKAMPAKLAESEVFRAADTQFDSDLVEAVLKLNFPEYLAELRTYKGIQLPENSYDPQGQVHTNS